MASIRQERISELIKRELSVYFQQNARTVCKGAMISVTIVRISKDLSVVKAYLSIFGGAESPQEVLENIREQKPVIRHELGKKMGKQLRIIPEFHYYLDDSIDYAENIDNLLKD